MTGLLWVTGAVAVLLVVGWWLSWLATRLDRAHIRVERSWGLLDTALARRAKTAVQATHVRQVDPATALLVCDAAAAALEPDLTRQLREEAESTLSHVLELVALPGLDVVQDRVALARRLHNDAVATARLLRRHRVVRALSLNGHAGVPKTFEMATGNN